MKATLAAAMDLVWIVLGTVLFWRFVGRPATRWLETVVGVRVLPRPGREDEPPAP